MGEEKQGFTVTDLKAMALDILRGLPEGFLPVPAERASTIVEKSGKVLRIAATAAQEASAAVKAMEAIQAPEDLAPGVAYTASGDMKLALETPVPFGYDVHWLKEIAEGVVRGTTGVRVDADGEARARAEIAGQFTSAVTREDAGGKAGVRVAIVQARSLSMGLSARAGVEASIDLPKGGGTSNLLGALFGIHPLQWVRDVLNDLGSTRVRDLAESVGANMRQADGLREAWQGMGARAEAALWKLMSETGAWEQFRKWIEFLSRGDWTGADLEKRIAEAMGSDPAFARTAAGEWLAAAAGEALDRVGEQASVERLRKAAAKLNDALAAPEAEQLLLALPLKAGNELNRDILLPWAQDRLEEMFGKRMKSLTGEGALKDWQGLRDRIEAAARKALERKWTAGISLALERTVGREALADATFTLDADGLAAVQRIVRGDLSPVFAGGRSLVRLRTGRLTHRYGRTSHIELHLPFLGRRMWSKDLRSLATAEAVEDGGRVLVQYAAKASDQTVEDFKMQSAMVFSAALSARDGEVLRDNFTLSVTDNRSFADAGGREPYRKVLEAYGVGATLPEAPCRTTLSVSLPGTLAETWFRTPAPASEEYFTVMRRVTGAVQTMARRWLPALYLGGLRAYHTPSAVHPLLAWQCTAASSGPHKHELSCDFMDQGAVLRVLNSGAASFPAALDGARRLLMEAGEKQTASYYDPGDARYILANVYRQRRNFVALLAADAFLVEEVMRVAACAREVDRLARVKDAAAVAAFARFSREVTAAFRRKLSRLYANSDFAALGPLFYVEATAALAPVLGEWAAPEAVLTIETEGGRQVYLNEAAQRAA